MNRLEIEECNDIEALKKLAIAQYKALFFIGETIVENSKWHCDAVDAIKDIKDYLYEHQHELYDMPGKEE